MAVGQRPRLVWLRGFAPRSPAGAFSFLCRHAASHRGGDRSRASPRGREPGTDHPLRAKDPSHPRPHLGRRNARHPMSQHGVTVVGIDVGGERKGFHAVALRAGQFVDTKSSTDPKELVKWCRDSPNANCASAAKPSNASRLRRANMLGPTKADSTAGSSTANASTANSSATTRSSTASVGRAPPSLKPSPTPSYAPSREGWPPPSTSCLRLRCERPAQHRLCECRPLRPHRRSLSHKPASDVWRERRGVHHRARLTFKSSPPRTSNFAYPLP